jgi:hypothetical protein
LATLPLVCRDIRQTTQDDDVFWHSIYDLHFGGPPLGAAGACRGGAGAASKPTTSSSDKQTPLSRRRLLASGGGVEEGEDKEGDEAGGDVPAAHADIVSAESGEHLAIHMWRRECERLLKELRDMEEVHQRVISCESCHQQSVHPY